MCVCLCFCFSIASYCFSSVIHWEKWDLEPSQRSQHLRMVLDIIRERMYPTDSCISWFCDFAFQFLSLDLPSTMLWHQLFDHISLERFIVHWCRWMHPPQWQLGVSLVHGSRRWTWTSVSLLMPTFQDCICW